MVGSNVIYKLSNLLLRYFVRNWWQMTTEGKCIEVFSSFILFNFMASKFPHCQGSRIMEAPSKRLNFSKICVKKQTNRATKNFQKKLKVNFLVKIDFG